MHQWRQWRQDDGISQKELALRSGVALGTIRRLEQKGRIPLKKFLRLAACLGGTLQLTRPKRRPTRLQQLQLKKGWSRQDDAEKIRDGKSSREELQRQNSLITPEQAADPAWKKKTLAAAMGAIQKKTTRLAIPKFPQP